LRNEIVGSFGSNMLSPQIRKWRRNGTEIFAVPF